MCSNTPTQVKHPWRATARTFVAAAVGAIPLIPIIAETTGLKSVAGVAVVVGFAGAVTRVLAVGAVDNWLRRFLPWLAASPG